MRCFLVGLACTGCGQTVDDMKAVRLECPRCGQFLEARYDLAAARREIDRDRLLEAPGGIWRLAPVLPVRNPEQVVTLMEGGTPLLPLQRWGARHGLTKLYAKDETRNPTGSFKDRGASVTISKCREVGIKSLVISSSGNASAAFSAYAAVGERTLYALIRPQTGKVLAAQNLIYGARTLRVRGTNREANRLASQLCQERGWFECTTPRNLYRIEGKKTIGYEVAQQLGWESPRWIVCPTGGGTNALALWKAFCEMKEMGWITNLPSLVVIQPEGCAPIVRAHREKAPVRPWDSPSTFADGLAVLSPGGGDAVLRAVDASGGLAETVSDEEIAAAERSLASLEGLFVQPASAASLAGLAKLVRTGVVAAGDRVVCVLTGTGKNAPDVAAEIAGDIPTIDADLESFAPFEVQN